MSTRVFVVHATTVAVLSALLIACNRSDTRIRVEPPKVDLSICPENTLRSLAERKGVMVGVAVDTAVLASEPEYARTLACEFNALVPENAAKMKNILKSENEYSFQDMDFLLRFAEDHKMTVRGHTLLWQNATPKWMDRRNWGKRELADFLDRYIRKVMGRYRGRIAEWDVVNEPFEKDGSFDDKLFMRVIGPEFIENAFRVAREADPTARLYLNEAGAELPGPKSDALYAFVEASLQKGVPIDGIGFQSHLRTDIPDLEHKLTAFRQNLLRFCNLGVNVAITEMDVAIREPVNPEKLEKQAHLYRSVFQLCSELPRCGTFFMWGFTDKHSWIPRFSPDYGSALIFDEAYHAKKAYYELQDALRRSSGSR